MIRNVHERTLDAPLDQVGPLIDGLATNADRLWPSDRWSAMTLDRPLAVGARGGHGTVRYRVSEYEPRRRIRFEFEPETGIDGMHELAIDALPDGRCRLRHVFIGRPRGMMRVLVPLVVESMHDAVIEDLFDNAERAATGRVQHPANWSLWVSICRRLMP